MHLHYDLIVIDSGPTGKRAAIQAARRVLLAEKNEIIGGVKVQTVFNYPTLAEAYKIGALDAYNRMTF